MNISQVDLQSVRDSVKYCCFLLEAEVTDSALLALSKEILLNKVTGIQYFVSYLVPLSTEI